MQFCRAFEIARLDIANPAPIIPRSKMLACKEYF